jgi:AcrR family transcriptional regulator
MGTFERRERERNELRKKILDAARELFVARGYDAVTMREIAARIEYSATALYKHFADKESLVRELCREDFTAFAQYFLERVGTSGDPVERLTQMGLVYLGFAERYPEHYRLMFMTELPPTHPEEGERDDPARNAYRLLRSLVTELDQGGLLREGIGDLDLVAQSIWAAVHGAAALDLIVPKSMDWVDFRPRRERFVAALEMVARSITRDPAQAVETLRRAVERIDALTPDAGGAGAPTANARKP